MSAFNDATCPKCKKRLHWTGKLTDRPACPRCGHQYPRQELEADQKEMDAFEKLLIERAEKKGAADDSGGAGGSGEAR